jgi:two-component system sensor histidine kinase DegS
MGLVSAVRWFAQQYSERSGVEVRFELVGVKRRLPSRVETVLFRIAQEGLNNIGRHAQAKKAHVELDFAPAGVTLAIEDDGHGFVVGDVLGTHSERRAWGLLGIQERVNLVGGKFNIDSAPGRGTKMTIEIPAEAEETVVA